MFWVRIWALISVCVWVWVWVWVWASSFLSSTATSRTKFTSLPQPHAHAHARHFLCSQIYFVPQRGWSIISDIDDTVKVTEVPTGAERILSNTLLKDFVVVEGMQDLYQEWEKQGAAFHYVSSSPWQLQPYFQNFFDRVGLPGGSFHLKHFDIQNRKFFNIFQSSTKLKPDSIQRIMSYFPDRRFLLVGDAGEKDPEIYASILRANPDQIGHIFIRRVDGDQRTVESLKETFEGIPDHKWTTFFDPKEILGALHHGMHEAYWTVRHTP